MHIGRKGACADASASRDNTAGPLFPSYGPILSKDVQHFNMNTINRLFSYCVFKLAESCTVQYVKVYSTI